MSKNNNKEVAKRIVDEAFDIKRELQFQEMMRWHDGDITGMEAIELIIHHDKLIIVPEKFDYYRKQIALINQQRNKGKK